MRTLRQKTLERETGIEPATNSLEGCDSTTELLPLFKPSHQLSAVSPQLKSWPRPPISTRSALNFWSR